jgi:hypothetical protein
MIDCSFCRALRLASDCSCLSLAMRLSRFLCANPTPPTRIPSICLGAHMGNAQIAPLGSCPWSQISRQSKPPGPPVTGPGGGGLAPHRLYAQSANGCNGLPWDSVFLEAHGPRGNWRGWLKILKPCTSSLESGDGINN